MNALQNDEINELNNERTVEAWKIESLESADWALRKIEALTADNAEKLELKNNEIKRLNDWYLKSTDANNFSIKFMQAKLKEYLDSKRKTDPKYKISTPHGTVSTRKGSKKLCVIDNDKAVQALMSAGLEDLIKTTKKVSVADLKKVSADANGRVISPDGVIIDGVQYEQAPDKLTITRPKGV